MSASEDELMLLRAFLADLEKFAQDMELLNKAVKSRTWDQEKKGKA